MKSLVGRLLFVLALVAACPAFAQTAATVEGMQMPAWLERAGRRMPLMPGMELRAGDHVTTGAGGRLALRLAEGSLIRLGENAQMRFAEVSAGRELFRAALNVLEGAFRFTTDLVAKARKREVSIRAAQVTAGIRGTDFWGRSRPGNEIVCLIEGEIEIAADGEQPVAMNQPLQFYRRENGKTQPVGTVEKAQLDKWSQETELEAGRGLRRGGKFSLLLATAPEQNAALALYDELRNAGYPAEIWPTKEDDKIVYVVRLRQLASRAEARRLADELKGKFGISDPKISG
jgi:hypothetical protein